MSEAGPPPTSAMRLPFFADGLRHAVLDVVLEVGGDALQPADRDRRILDAAAAAGRLARAIAGASENSRKHVRSPIDHVGVAVAAFGDQADVFWNGRMRGTGPLAIDHFVEVVGRRNISRFHSYLVRADFKERRGLIFACERSVGVLVVFELDHRLTLLEPFRACTKAILSHHQPSLVDSAVQTFHVAAVQHVQMRLRVHCKSAWEVALREVPHQAIEAGRDHSGSIAASSRGAPMAADTAFTSVPSISTNQSPAPGLGPRDRR